MPALPEPLRKKLLALSGAGALAMATCYTAFWEGHATDPMPTVAAYSRCATAIPVATSLPRRPKRRRSVRPCWRRICARLSP